MFECQLKSPPIMSLIDHSLEQYICQHRFNFKNWKLVDLDNYMRGNPLFSDFLTEDQWQDRFKEDGKTI